MAHLPRGVAQPAELIKRLNGLVFTPEYGVVKWRHTVDDDWSGDPAIFFWITLSDAAADRNVLSRTTRRIKDFIIKQIDPAGEWDLIPYFHFRSQSEQEKLKDKVFG